MRIHSKIVNNLLIFWNVYQVKGETLMISWKSLNQCQITGEHIQGQGHLHQKYIFGLLWHSLGGGGSRIGINVQLGRELETLRPMVEVNLTSAGYPRMSIDDMKETVREIAAGNSLILPAPCTYSLTVFCFPPENEWYKPKKTYKVFQTLKIGSYPSPQVVFHFGFRCKTAYFKIRI